jgi:hypothetical protein
MLYVICIVNYLMSLMYSIRIFSIAGIIGVFVLLPLNYTGNQLRTVDWADIPNQSLDLFTIANVQDGSKRLYIDDFFKTFTYLEDSMLYLFACKMEFYARSI